MNKIIIYLSVFFIILLSACEPIENRLSIGDPIKAEQLNISATPVMVNGKRSNKIIMENHSPVMSNWNYGVGVSQKMTDTVLLVITGDNDILFTGLNPDGTTINKTLTVNVEELSFSVPAEWGYLCGEGEKEWVWAESKCWGNGGYLASTEPSWWVLNPDGMEEQAKGEGANASMIFSISGASLTKNKSDGTSLTGTFSFDLTKTKTTSGGILWAKGQFKTTGVTILCGVSPDEDKIAVNTFDILELTSDRLVLAYAPAGTGEWGTAYFWVFIPKK
ncbi:MAG TPA: hypothetical protein DDZ96_09175 [Porphyromonadaceae bacterium]|jgi:hypothetical protein|uniref:hypothetical protein n=1 Tax=Limibacterium fermenti TaxID=3229863 RepID=UPI000E8E0A8A|nr:hypothetical protein [Porphyromonadaceae bacterium]HBL33967.1 hypothetical protein [Porphyromonadaceae bacterium]HBX18886.1 hypothetical protein [Porphyromonadaceae bacterium]HBX44392.1 hypothetical protein [Porphyromonadaceae bacterium]HCM21159.1 hypothetical protein [Porphyromonadaceae bacterium]